MRRTVMRLSLPLREPWATAGGVIGERELLLLRVEDDDGLAGYGEAAPFEPYDGTPIELVVEALRGEGSGEPPPQARAAEEMARLDLEARRRRRAVGEPGADAIAVNSSIAAGPPEEVFEGAKRSLSEGYSCFKVKVGLPDDIERVAAVREAIGSWPALRLDANGSWSVEQAIVRIGELARFDLELVEQPCRTLAELAEVRAATEMPLAADEAIASPADVRAAVAAHACDAVNVKLAPCGGFGAARETLRAAAEHGLEGFVSSTLDGPWGIAAALQLVASEDVSLACGLATLDLFDAALARALPRPAGGLLSVPQGPGLGVNFRDGDLDAVLVEEVLVEELAR